MLQVVDPALVWNGLCVDPEVVPTGIVGSTCGWCDGVIDVAIYVIASIGRQVVDLATGVAVSARCASIRTDAVERLLTGPRCGCGLHPARKKQKSDE